MLAEEGLRPQPLGNPIVLAPVLLAGMVVVTAAAVSGAHAGELARVVAAGIGVWLVGRAAWSAVGRPRRVRAFTAVAAAVWLVSEVARAGHLVDGDTALTLAQVSIGVIGVCAIATYVAAAHGRFRTPDEAALYCDGAILALAVAAAVLVLGDRFVTDEVGLEILIHAAFFPALLASTFLLTVSVHVPFRWVGNWELLVGLAVAAVAYTGLLVPNLGDASSIALNAIVGVGALLVCRGAARWTDEQDDGERYRRVAGFIRRALPLASVALTGALSIALVTQPQLLTVPLRLAAAVALVLTVILAIARQTFLLADRERVIERERRLADELMVAEAQYRAVVERVPGVVYVAEAGEHGRWHFVSPKIEELVGYTPDEWMADPTLWMERMHPADKDRMILAEKSDAERTDERGRWEYRLIARDGRVVWVIDDEAVIARGADGRPAMVQGILVDISDRKALEDQLRHQALHDPLTGLPNRVLFVDRLAHALVRRGAEAQVAVLFVDLDNFKSVNDTLGHAAGDELLQLISDRVPEVLRIADTACRMGGDEFAFLLENADRERAEEAADRILDALAQPFTIGGRSVTLTASIGIATWADGIAGSGAGETADAILRDADTAMYAAKALGKGRVQTFERGMNEPIARRRDLDASLPTAVAAGELFLEYQPIVDMRDRQILGVEALVRWNHSRLGRVAPAEFIGLAESSGAIDRIGEYVLRQASADLASTPLLVSVNISAHQLATGKLPALVANVLDTTGLPPSRLMLELTETALASSDAGAEAELQSLRALGVRLALDDFGSGYSSLEYLGRLPVDILKIDRSLVATAHVDRQRREVLRAIGHIADKLGLETIVEGVELEAQRVALLDLGFRRAQGYLFAEPMPLDAALTATTRARAS